MNMSQVAHQARVYTGVSTPPWIGLLGNTVLHPIKFAGTHLYTLVEGRTAKVKCHTQEYNTVSTAGAQTWTTQSIV